MTIDGKVAPKSNENDENDDKPRDMRVQYEVNIQV